MRHGSEFGGEWVEERAEESGRGCGERGTCREDSRLPRRRHHRSQEGRSREKAPNEANFCDDVCIAQHQEIIEVPANSGGVSGVDDCQTNPIFLETKPIPAGGAEAGGAGGSTQPVGRALTEHERRDAWKEIRRREWLRARAEKEARERERLARLNSGVARLGETPAASGGAMPPQDVRGP